MRINKYLAYCGLCSRREADRYIVEKRVNINGRTAVPGDSVSESDLVSVDGKILTPPDERTYLAFYKPYGVICTFAQKEQNSLIRYTKDCPHATYAGRLDVRSEGLLLLTDDGDLIHALMTGKYAHEKEYVVGINGTVTEDGLRRLQNGIFLPALKTKTRKCKAWQSAEREFHIILTQGLNRQIRRMCDVIGWEITYLKRIRIENILIGSLRPGEKRQLDPDEIKELKNRVMTNQTQKNHPAEEQHSHN